MLSTGHKIYMAAMVLLMLVSLTVMAVTITNSIYYGRILEGYQGSPVGTTETQSLMGVNIFLAGLSGLLLIIAIGYIAVKVSQWKKEAAAARAAPIELNNLDTGAVVQATELQNFLGEEAVENLAKQSAAEKPDLSSFSTHPEYLEEPTGSPTGTLSVTFTTGRRKHSSHHSSKRPWKY